MFYQNYAYIFAMTTIVFNSKNHSYGKEKCKGRTHENTSHRE